MGFYDLQTLLKFLYMQSIHEFAMSKRKTMFICEIENTDLVF